MGRQELILTYPPEAWICPNPECNHKHSKAHYSLPGQIDYSKKPGEKGRILFNRRNKEDQLATDTPIDYSLPDRGEPFDEEGCPRPLFCPHCGYEDDVVIVIRTGELPNIIERFFKQANYKRIPETWRKVLSEFHGWLKRERGNQ